MLRRTLLYSLPWLAALAGAPGALRAQDLNAVIAGLREDIRILDERTRSLQVEMEQLRRENAALREQSSKNAYVTLAQLNSAVADLERAIRSGDQQVLAKVADQMEKLVKQTNEYLAAVSKGAASSRPGAPAVQFTDDYPKNGPTYTVQPGDTLLGIAQKFGAQVRDIQNANRIADPRLLQVGQTLFIPQR